MIKLEEEYEAIYPKIYAFFYSKTGNRMTAQDLCHDTFYEACKNIGSFNGRSTFSTWVFSIATKFIKKILSKKQVSAKLNAKTCRDSRD